MRIFIHKTCPTSQKILEILRDLGVLGMAEIIDVENEPLYLISLGFVHVPAILVDNQIFDYGPIKFDEFEKSIIDYRLKIEEIPKKLSRDDLINILYEDILDNLFLSLSVFLREKVSIVLKYKPTMTKITRHIDKQDLNNFIKYVENNDYDLYKEIEEKLIKYIAFSFIRELFWIHNRKISIENFDRLYPLPVFVHWVLARSSISRVGLICDITKNHKIRNKIFLIRQIIQEKWERYWEKILGSS